MAYLSQVKLGNSTYDISAIKLKNARTIQTNLASVSSASFNGTANITPGVTGVLGIGNGGTGANNRKTAITNLGVFGLYERNDIGTSPNFDNPGVNGLFELRSKSETTGETGIKPYDGFGPFISLKYSNTMFQLAGTNANGFYIRGKQAANVTLAGVNWQKLLTSGNYTDYTVTKTGSGASGTWGINISGNAATATKATKDGSGNTITSKYVTLDTAQTISGTKTMTAGLNVSGRCAGGGDDEGIAVGFASNGYAGLCLGRPSQARSVFYFKSDGSNPFWRYNNGSASYDISHPSKSGTIALTSDLANYLPLSGGTMTGEIKTSFKSSVAMGSYQAAATTIPNLVEEVRYSSGCMGSVSIGTAYTASNGGTIAAGWYNFIYSPHRSGGNNGAASGDNHLYGNLILMSMTDNFGCWNIRVSGGSISTSKRIWLAGDSVTGAVWNDYAEYRESDCDEFGYILMENGDDTLSKTIERLSHFAGVSSDTWGFSQGETDKAKTPIAVAGRVLVYPYQDRNNYKPGDCVCAAPGGTVDIMTREEVREWPDRIVGTVSCVPDYEEWGGGEGADRDPVKVNGRIWIKIR